MKTTICIEKHPGIFLSTHLLSSKLQIKTSEKWAKSGQTVLTGPTQIKWQCKLHPKAVASLRITLWLRIWEVVFKGNGTQRVFANDIEWNVFFFFISEKFWKHTVSYRVRWVDCRYLISFNFAHVFCSFFVLSTERIVGSVGHRL